MYIFRGNISFCPIVDLNPLKSYSFQFDAVENGISVTKLIQVFSKQAAMMDALISHFTEQIKRRKESNASVENTPQMPALDPDNDGKTYSQISYKQTLTFDNPPFQNQIPSKIAAMVFCATNYPN